MDLTPLISKILNITALTNSLIEMNIVDEAKDIIKFNKISKNRTKNNADFFA